MALAVLGRSEAESSSLYTLCLHPFLRPLGRQGRDLWLIEFRKPCRSGHKAQGWLSSYQGTNLRTNSQVLRCREEYVTAEGPGNMSEAVFKEACVKREM